MAVSCCCQCAILVQYLCWGLLMLRQILPPKMCENSTLAATYNEPCWKYHKTCYISPVFAKHFAISIRFLYHCVCVCEFCACIECSLFNSLSHYVFCSQHSKGKKTDATAINNNKNNNKQNNNKQNVAQRVNQMEDEIYRTHK